MITTVSLSLTQSFVLIINNNSVIYSIIYAE